MILQIWLLNFETSLKSLLHSNLQNLYLRSHIHFFLFHKSFLFLVLII